MRFVVLPHRRLPQTTPRSTAYLITDNWDDWFQFSTMYHLIYVNEEGEYQRIGDVKIGQFQMGEDQRRPNIPADFESLDESFFSLGQDVSYYERLNNLGDDLRDTILIAMNDAAKNLELFDRALEEKVTGVSLLRSVTKSTVRGQYHRLTQGGARLTEYEFTYLGPKQLDKGVDRISMYFYVKPDSEPPTNIHVLIGRNGVGKTYLLQAMARSLVQPDESEEKFGRFQNEEFVTTHDLFANIVSVTFSAFDSFEPFSEPRDKSTGIRYSYVGLKKKSGSGSDQPDAPKTPGLLGRDFALSAKVCSSQNARTQRWQQALRMLESDPIFAEAEVSTLADIPEETKFKIKASKLFSKLSSGHKIVLLTITKLVETVEERTLVLLDEPEAHLHPPLLSAFIRSLSDLLIDRNGVAIVATHSPVVLQEVPKSCVWKVRRTGGRVKIDRPEIETFGENVGVLTREIFGLEVTDSGFHKLLKESVIESDSYEEAISNFNWELGDEAKAIIQALMSKKNDLEPR